MQNRLWTTARDLWSVVAGVLVVGAPTALLLTHVWYEYRITRLGYQISKETRRHERLIDEHRELTVEATLLQRDERSEDVIRRRYGLKRIQPDQVVTIEPPNSTANRTESDSTDEQPDE